MELELGSCFSLFTDFPLSSWNFSPIKKAACDKWSLTHMLPHLMKKIFKRRGLHLRNCLKRFKGFEAEEERIDVYAASSWVELAQGLIRDQQHTPPRAPAFHSAIGFSLTIQGLIDEPLSVFQPCTFLNLKSQFILGKHIRRREKKKNFKTLFFFTPCQHSIVIHKLSEHSLINCLRASHMSRALTTTKAEAQWYLGCAPLHHSSCW